MLVRSRGGGSRGFGSFGRKGNRGGSNRSSGYHQDPPEEVIEIGYFTHTCEDDIVCHNTSGKIPYFNAAIFFENKEQIGKVDEIFGGIKDNIGKIRIISVRVDTISYFSRIISVRGFTVKLQNGVKASSFKEAQKLYIDSGRLLPIDRFFPNGASKRGKGQIRGSGRGSRGHINSDRSRFRGRGGGSFNRSGDRGGFRGGSRGNFGNGKDWSSRGNGYRGNETSGGFRGRGRGIDLGNKRSFGGRSEAKLTFVSQIRIERLLKTSQILGCASCFSHVVVEGKSRMSFATGDLWLISAPNEGSPQETWDKLNRTTASMSVNYKFNVPDLKVGTLDQLVGLSDDLAKLDTSAEQVTRKLTQYFADVLEDEQDKLQENLIVSGKDVKTYVTKFQWESAKYPLKQSLKVLSDIIGKQITQIDNDLKTKSTAYNNLKNSLASIDRKTTGSLLTKDLSEIVKADDFILNSEYLQTLLVVIPKTLAKEWQQKYESLSDMVVPGSSRLIIEDGDQMLFSVTLFKKVIDEYKTHCRENKFIVRDFVYNEESLKIGRNERDKLVQEKQRQYAPLVRWLKINFGEIFSAFVHVKALRVFVESVLRYGLPVNFQATVIEPNKNSHKKLRASLHNLYLHLDTSAAGPIESIEDNPILMSLGMHDYYPSAVWRTVFLAQELHAVTR
ncbi:V-type proton ATPase subunit C [Dirofilaria immitis]|nr:V-type proton ATPase subunit C [Dirofilaria immitis]